MSAKAYLFMRINVAVFPPIVVGAETGSGPLTSRTISGIGSDRWVELCHVRANTWEQAEAKLLAMVSGQEPCPFGDLRFLLPFLERGMPAHMERYWLGELIRETPGRLTPVATALNYARQQVRARMEAPDAAVFPETGPEDTDDDGWQ